jgi:hypothetical protein
MRASLLLLALVPTFVAGCFGAGPYVADDADAPPSPDPGPRRTFRTCRDRPYTPAPLESWRHSFATPLTTAAGVANHSAQDPIATRGVGIVLHGKFAYGAISKDLEDERVRVWIDDCTGWRALGDARTDDDGRVAVAAPDLGGPGVYEARFQVLGDGSETRALVWVLPVGTRLVIADVDGTLTPSGGLPRQILDGSYVPPEMPGAIDLTHAHAARGHVVLYLTGRPYWLTERTRDWLDGYGFAAGPVHMGDDNIAGVPTEGGVGEFKRDFVADLLTAGYAIDAAYGDARTDVFAYLDAGVPPELTWIIGRNGGDDGTHAVDGSWAARAAEVTAGPPVVQPFDW